MLLINYGRDGLFSKMLRAYYQRMPFAVWDPEELLWMVPDQPDIFGRLGVYSETWPDSGMTLDGRASLLPELERLTEENGFLGSPSENQLFKTPLAQDPSTLTDAGLAKRLASGDFQTALVQILELTRAPAQETILDLFENGGSTLSG